MIGEGASVQAEASEWPSPAGPPSRARRSPTGSPRAGQFQGTSDLDIPTTGASTSARDNQQLSCHPPRLLGDQEQDHVSFASSVPSCPGAGRLVVYRSTSGVMYPVRIGPGAKTLQVTPYLLSAMATDRL